MGVIKKLFGGGTAKTVEVTPTVQAVQTADTSADVENSNTTKKKRAGFSSTQAAPTALTSANDTANRQTLG